ncbi:Uncharacterized protein TCM_012386 [Theobroma cacao]|uniref:Retrovirus-related Pol polyprotein from transposon TNT 1-94-like beta-barrel domain-containing protein n=1 Tax=Theobroma cacao TaxID=3641 RepID=A0A061FUY9_THECC|nr:Uncharacterized protein TCM_012386 [Theobroma cacao]
MLFVMRQVEVVDSGTCSHVTVRRDFFTSYTSGDYGILRMANNGVSRVTSIKAVCVKTSIGTKLFLNNVKHAPDNYLHLISTSVHDDKSYFNTFGGEKWKLTKGSLIMGHGKKHSGLY